eukprot:612833-Prorocentrum_minimum.AAC.2
MGVPPRPPASPEDEDTPTSSAAPPKEAHPRLPGGGGGGDSSLPVPAGIAGIDRRTSPAPPIPPTPPPGRAGSGGLRPPTAGPPDTLAAPDSYQVMPIPGLGAPTPGYSEPK